jgi:DNA-binding NarL/FixJ family response regulator
MITIFIAESQKHVREALRLMFEYQPEFEVVGEASTVESTLAQVCQQLPDVILLDWELPGIRPHRMLPAIKQCSPATLIFATSVRPEEEAGARQFGVKAFLSKQLPPHEFMAQLVSAVDRTNQGREDSR